MAFVDRVIRAESGGDPLAQSRTSSASGLGQFTRDTFVSLYRKSIGGKGLSDDQIWDKRFDEPVQRKLLDAAEGEYTKVLTRANLPVTDANKYMLHFLGTSRGVAMLRAPGETPAAALVPQSWVDANGPILRGTVRDVADFTSRKMGDGQSTYDRVRAARASGQDEPSIAELYGAYRAGRMSPQGRAQFESDVSRGVVQLPRGAKIRDVPAHVEPETVAPDIVAAFNDGSMPQEGRARLQADLKRGLVKLPKGVTLTGPPEQGVGRSLGLGVGGVVSGLANIAGVVTNPLNSALNMTGLPQAVTGRPLGTDLGGAAREALGLPEPVTPQERLTDALVQGGAGALGGAGVAAPIARGATNAVTREVAQTVAGNPVRDVIAGVTGGAGAYYGGEVGGTPGAFVGALVGGVGGAAAAGRATRLAESIAERFPRAAIVDTAGNLTENGAEIVARTGADPEQVVEVYARRRAVGRSPQRRTPEQAAEARAVAREKADAATPEQRARAASREPAPEPPAPPDLETRTARLTDAIAERVPPVRDPGAERVGTRFDEARSEGIPLTRGQSEQDFGIQNDENRLKVAATDEGAQARQFFSDQIDRIKDAFGRLRDAFGNTTTNATDRGALVQQAVSDLRDEGAEGVRRLYREAEALGGDGLTLNTDGIRRAAQDVIIDEAVAEPIKKAVSQELARYGIIGEAAPMNEAGITKVTLDDGSSVQFRGPVKQLTASNAEDLRRAINRLYDPTKPNLSGQAIKPAIDDALEEALERAATGSPEGQIGDAYRAARDAHIAQRQTFHAKDIIQDLADTKKGTQTASKLPDRAIAETIGAGKEGLTNLRKVKALLLGSNRPVAVRAWRAIQQQVIANLIDVATTRNVNLGSGVGVTDAISGAKLRTAIEKFGMEKLRLVLDEPDFNQLMKLRRITENATIPATGTVNHSGTFTQLANWLGRGALRFSSHIPGLGQAGEAAAALVGKARDLAATRKTLEGITSYDGRIETSRRLDQQAREFIEQYIADGKAGRLVPAAVNLRVPPAEQGQ